MPHAHTLHGRVGTRPWARAVALLALLLGAAGVAFLVWGVVTNPLLALVTVVMAPVFLALVFLSATSEGHRRRLAAVAAIGLAVVIVVVHVIFNVTQDDWQAWGVIGLALLAGATGAARYALRIPPPSLDEVLRAHEGPRHVDHPVLVINLKSGGGKAEEFGLVDECRKHGIDTRILRPGLDLPDLAREAAASGADALGMAGGDGSLACVAEIAVQHDIPFVCIPAGTRNHFALDLGLDRNDPRQALAAFISGEERVIDYATVNGRPFLNNVSLGVYAAIVAQDSYRDAKLDTTLQLLPTLVNEGGPWFDLHFDVPEHGRLEEAAILQVSNNPYAPGGELGRRSRLDTGELGLVTADPKHLGDLVSLTMLAAAGRAGRSSALWVWSSPTFRVESGQSEQSAGVDGETVSLATPLEFAVVPKGLRVLVPPGTRVGLDEQQVGTGRTVTDLLTVALGLGGPDT